MCVKTIPAWKAKRVVCSTSKMLGFGKPSRLIFNRPHNIQHYDFLHIPCGQCIECRLEYSRLWAMRCMHEASLYEDNCFITLTFNDHHLDSNLSLRKDSFQKFMKRLRKYLFDHRFRDSESNCEALGAVRQAKRVRYFHAGEYGEQFGRPHHHAILFGYDFPDKKFKVERRGNNFYESDILSKLWSDPKTGESLGFAEVTNVTFETCAYVARYVCKKVTGEMADDHYSFMDDQGNFHDRLPEFCTMSRRPGIGFRWYQKYRDTDAYSRDSIHVRGNFRCKPPRFYDGKYELDCPGEYAILKENRLKKSKDNPDNSFERQKVREVVKKAQYKFLKRSLV